MKIIKLNFLPTLSLRLMSCHECVAPSMSIQTRQNVVVPKYTLHVISSPHKISQGKVFKAKYS